jgi:hypothetical protein
MGRAGRGSSGDDESASAEGPEPTDPHEQLDDWLNCRSSRRLYVTLSESGIDTFPLVVAVGLFLRILDPQAPALAAVRPRDLVYEGMIHLSSGLGEELTCALIRRIYPEPPARLRGSLATKIGSPTERSQRYTPNARVWIEPRLLPRD